MRDPNAKVIRVLQETLSKVELIREKYKVFWSRGYQTEC